MKNSLVSVVSRVRPAVGRGYFHWVKRPLDIAAMTAAGRLLLGRHDFAAFASNPGYERKHGTVRTLQHLHLRRRPWGFDLAVQGDGNLVIYAPGGQALWASNTH